MHRIRAIQTVISCCLLLVCLAGSAQGQSGSAKVKRYISRDGYSLEVPTEWEVSENANGFFITSFPGREAVQSWFPHGGAKINVVTWKGTTAQSLDEWIDNVLRVADRRSVLVHPATPNPSGMTNLTKIEYDFSLFEREGPQRHVAYFFNFDQKMFQASVSYWKSDSKGPEREQVLKDIVQSLRHENNPPKSAGSQASPESNGASTVQVGAVSLWKTLINRAGWSVQCPPGWKVLSCTYCPDVTDPDVFVSFHPPSGHGVITIEHLADKPVNRSTDQWFDWIEHAADANVRMSEETMSLDGRQAVRVRYRYLGAPETEAEREILYVIDKSRTFEISVWVDERGVSIENRRNIQSINKCFPRFDSRTIEGCDSGSESESADTHDKCVSRRDGSLPFHQR